jgi:hypothetical protein
VRVTFPAPPDGQGGFFNGTQVPVVGTVTASDPSGVAGIECIDREGGVTLGPLTGAGSGTASRTLTVSGDGDHVIACVATDAAHAPNTGVAPARARSRS